MKDTERATHDRDPSERYFDYAASAPPFLEALTSQTEAARKWFGNPSAAHGPGESARAELERLRGILAARCGFTDGRLVPMSGATEANNWIVHGVMRAAGAGRVLVAEDVHASVACDFYTFAAHKFGGPRGCGGVFLRSDAVIPLLNGGAQEGGLRPGTENLPAVAGTLAALEQVQAVMTAETERLRELTRTVLRGLDRSEGPFKVNGNPEEGLPGFLSLTFPDLDGHALVADLSVQGFAVASGSACSENHAEPSRAILALGRSPAEALGTGLLMLAGVSLLLAGRRAVLAFGGSGIVFGEAMVRTLGVARGDTRIFLCLFHGHDTCTACDAMGRFCRRPIEAHFAPQAKAGLLAFREVAYDGR